MKCWKCGKEIPDDRKYCGYCGAEQKTDEKETPVLKGEDKEEPVSVEEKVSDNKDTSVETADQSKGKDPAEDSGSEEKTADTAEVSSDETSEENKQENEPVSEKNDSKDSEEKSDTAESEKHPVSIENKESEESPVDKADTHEEDLTGSEEKENKTEQAETSAEESDTDSQKSSDDSDEQETVMDDASDPDEDTQNISMPDDTQDAEFTKSEENHKDEKKWKMPDLSAYGITINAEDFRRVFVKIRKPLEDQPFNGVSAVISFIVMWIINWITFRSFGTGLIITAVLVLGVMIMMAVENHDQFNWKNAFNESCETVVSGALPMIIGGILLDSASGQSSYSFIHIFSTSFFGIFFILLAVIMFVSEIFRTRKFNKYAEVVLTAVLLLVVLWIASASNPEAFVSLFH